ncbi:MAG: S-layer homology domain-containing protein, partial [Bacteroidales bacterium]|nr:S-layer homology domain-containing protein [Bacteroidales bacterium]
YALHQGGETTEYGDVKTFTTRKEGGGSSGSTPTRPTPTVPEEVKTPPAGEVGYLNIPEDLLALGSGNVILFTDPLGGTDILGLGIVEGQRMKYISRGAGNYKIIYNARPFDDIDGHWAKDDIDFSSARLLYHGVTPNLFAPESAMTRGMFVAVIGRMYGVDAGKYTDSRFTDVEQELYYAPFIQWAAEEGIVFGVSASSFEPERPVTRQEMAAIMQRFMDYLEINLTNTSDIFADDEQISDWARENVYMMRGTGIMNGRSDNKFVPHANSTRAEVAVVFKRLIEHIVNKGQ